MAENVAAQITIEEYTGTEKAFDPGAVRLEFDLRRIEENLTPPRITLADPPKPRPYTEKAALIDIETTGLYPWDARLICVGVLDLQHPNLAPSVFVGEDEEQVIKNFVAWYEAQDFGEVWAYNGIFDARFLFGVCLRYRIQAPTLFKVVWHDLISYLKKTKEEYVEGTQKAGTLNQWAEYALGRTKLLTFPQLMALWEERDLEAIVEYNVDDLDIEYELWLLIKYTTGEYMSLPASLVPPGSELVTGETKLATCKTCGQVNEIPEDATNFECVACEDITDL